MNSNPLPLWDEPTLRPYLGEIKRRYGYVETIALPSLRDLPPLRIESVFIHPLLSEDQVDAAIDPKLWQTGTPLLDALQAECSLVLLGDPGSGKTTLANWLSWRLSAGLQAPLPPSLNECLPIPCTLRELSLYDSTTDNISDLAIAVATRLLGDRMNEDLVANIRSRISFGKFVLILDGIDEIPVLNRRIVAKWIRQTNELHGFCLATARIVGYEDYPVDRDAESMSAKFAAENLDVLSPHVQHELSNTANASWAAVRYLVPFDDSRISAFVENWYSQRCAGTQEARQKASDLLEALGKSESMQSLARTPNLLSLMAIVHRERANLPDGKALLYKEISNAYINTIDQQRQINDRDPLAMYSWETREGWIAYIGFQMQLKRLSENSPSHGSGILSSRTEVITWLQEAMRMSHVKEPELRAKEFLNWISRRSGLLIPRSDELYAFAHLSFQEYFCARHVAIQVMSRQFIRTGSSSDQYVTKPKLRDWAADPTWRESLIFFLEIVSAENESGWTEEFLEALFGDLHIYEALDNSRAKLAARVISNQHIHFSPEIKELLTHQASSEAFDEWRYSSSRSDRSILKHLVDARAVIVAFDEKKQDRQTSGISRPKLEEIMAATETTPILILRDSNQEVLDQISTLNKLRFASITFSSIDDINIVATSPDLEILEINDTLVSDITPLVHCPALNELDIGHTKVEDISCLTKLRNLRTLILNYCKITNFTPLKALQLGYLSLTGTRINSLEKLVGLTDLFYLSLDETDVIDLSQIRKLKNLHGIGLSSTPVDDLEPLLDLKKLGRLDINVCKSSNPAIIGKLVKLSVLHFGLNEPGEISFLKNLSNLRSLTLYGPHINDISIVSLMPNLQELHLKGTSVDENKAAKIAANVRQVTINGRSVTQQRGASSLVR